MAYAIRPPRTLYNVYAYARACANNKGVVNFGPRSERMSYRIYSMNARARALHMLRSRHAHARTGGEEGDAARHGPRPSAPASVRWQRARAPCAHAHWCKVTPSIGVVRIMHLAWVFAPRALCACARACAGGVDFKGCATHTHANPYTVRGGACGHRLRRCRFAYSARAGTVGYSFWQNVGRKYRLITVVLCLRVCVCVWRSPATHVRARPACVCVCIVSSVNKSARANCIALLA